MKKTNKQGFTLVELSIVLVIIGLLIGGILVAQSLIDSTKIQSFARAIGQYDAAVGTFKDRFGDLPGDSDLFNPGGGATDPDGDGIIEGDASAGDQAAVAVHAEETALFWQNLSRTGLKNEEGGDYGTSYVAGTDVPRSPVGSSTTGIFVVGHTDMPVLEDFAATANVYVAMDCSGMSSSTLACDSGISGPDGLAIDTKLDDGSGTAGNIGTFDAAADAIVDWGDVVDATETAYDPTTTTDDDAVLVIRMGSSLGTLY